MATKPPKYLSEVAKHLAETLTAWGVECEVSVEHISGHDFRLVAVSPSFELVHYLDRQDVAWKIATGADWLSNDEGYNIKVIWTMTPGEMEAACALE